MAGPVTVTRRSHAERNASLRQTRQNVASRRSARDIARRAPDPEAYNADTVAGLNKAREDAITAGANPYGGSLKSYQSYSANNPTVITDATIRDKVGPQIQQDTAMALAKADQANAGLQAETQAKEQKQIEKDKNKDPMEGLFSEKEDAIDPYAQKQLDLIDRAMKSKDSSTRLLADRYKTIFDRQRAQQNEVSAIDQGNAGTSLQRLGGRYTPGAAGQIQGQIQRQNLEKLAEIDDAEMSAVEELRLAQENKDIEMQGQKLEVLKSIRNERIAQLESIRKAEADERKAVDDVVRDAAENGAPAEVRAAIAGAQTASEAVQLAGDYLQTGTGVIGEYLFYKRQAESLGQIPLSFDKYQDMDANRKIPASSRSSGGSSSSAGGSPANSALGLVDSNGKPVKLTATQAGTLTSFKDTVGTAYEALDLLEKGVDTGPIAGNALQIAKQFETANPDQLKLEQVVGKLKADYIKAISGAAASENEVKRLSKFLPEITDTEQVIKSKLNTIISEIERNRENFLETLGVTQGVADTGTDLLQTEEQAKDQVDTFYAGNPEQRPVIESLLAQEFTNAEVFDYLKTKGLI